MRSQFAVIALLSVTLLASPVFAQPQLMPPQALDQLIQRIALYPDSLLSQVLAASTYWDQIPDAARWADAHHYLQGQALADAISRSGTLGSIGAGAPAFSLRAGHNGRRRGLDAAAGERIPRAAQ